MVPYRGPAAVSGFWVAIVRGVNAGLVASSGLSPSFEYAICIEMWFLALRGAEFGHSGICWLPPMGCWYRLLRSWAWFRSEGWVQEGSLVHSFR